MVTNYIKNASYKEIYDLHTDSHSTSVLTFHSPVTSIPRQILGGFFDQYRRFKYKGMTVKLRPAARLPADPAQISYEEGEAAIDPRDMLNPILIRGYCGDSLGWFLNYWNTPGNQSWVRQPTSGASRERFTSAGFFGSTVDRTSFPDSKSSVTNGNTMAFYLENLYYQSLSDPGWRKIPMQKGYKRSFRPLVYELATTAQRLASVSPTATQRMVTMAGDEAAATVTDFQESNLITRPNNAFDTGAESGASSARTYVMDSPIPTFGTTYTGQIASATNQVRLYRRTAPILTSHKRPLGWLDTDTVVDHRTPTFKSDSDRIVNTIESSYTATLYPNDGPGQAYGTSNPDDVVLPLINMAVAVLPKAYKQEMFYRLEITHHFDFKDYRPLIGLVSPFDSSSVYGSRLEWSDWDDATIVTPGPSVTSTSKNFELVDVVPSGPGDTE